MSHHDPPADSHVSTGTAPQVGTHTPCEYYTHFPAQHRPEYVCPGIAIQLTMRMQVGGEAELLALCPEHREIVRRRNASYFVARRKAASEARNHAENGSS